MSWKVQCNVLAPGDPLQSSPLQNGYTFRPNLPTQMSSGLCSVFHLLWTRLYKIGGEIFLIGVHKLIRQGLTLGPSVSRLRIFFSGMVTCTLALRLSLGPVQCAPSVRFDLRSQRLESGNIPTITSKSTTPRPCSVRSSPSRSQSPCLTLVATSPTNFSNSLVLATLPRRSVKSVKVLPVNRRKEESQSEYVRSHNTWNGDRVKSPVSNHPQPRFALGYPFGVLCWTFGSADTGEEGPESEDGQDSNPYPLEGKYIDDADRQKCVFLHFMYVPRPLTTRSSSRLLSMPEIEREGILEQRLEEMQRFQDARNLDQMVKAQKGGESEASKVPKRTRSIVRIKTP